MIVRSLARAALQESADYAPMPAFEAFLETQKEVRPPYAVLFQSEHARLSGALAQALSADVFGVLPPDVIEAISSHDAGWDESDVAQVEQLYCQNPRPFPLLPTDETLPSWQRCIKRAQDVGDLAGVLVSRHFAFVGSSEPDRQEFLRTEALHRQAIEGRLGNLRNELDRWTAALGFCDVLSLYLCSGCRKTVVLPLAHPASPAARQAETVKLFWRGESPCFSKPLIESGARFHGSGYTYSADRKAVEKIVLTWRWS